MLVKVIKMITMLVKETAVHDFNVYFNIEEEIKVYTTNTYTRTETGNLINEVLSMLYDEYGWFYDFDDVMNENGELDTDLCFDVNGVFYVTTDENFFLNELYYKRETTIFYPYSQNIESVTDMMCMLTSLVTY